MFIPKSSKLKTNNYIEELNIKSIGETDMKKALTLLALSLFALPVQADSLELARNKVKQIFISDEEPKVKECDLDCTIYL